MSVQSLATWSKNNHLKFNISSTDAAAVSFAKKFHILTHEDL